jgi:hypothetical protein
MAIAQDCEPFDERRSGRVMARQMFLALFLNFSSSPTFFSPVSASVAAAAAVVKTSVRIVEIIYSGIYSTIYIANIITWSAHTGK